MNSSQPWSTEIIRLLAFAFAVLPLHSVTASWLLAAWLATWGYILFMLLQLYRLYRWYERASETSIPPDCSGIWQYMLSKALQSNKRLLQARQQHQDATRQFQETMSAIPIATVMLNADNEIEWANYPALTLLGINVYKDIGVRIEHLLRQPHIIDELQKKNHERFEIHSPIDDNIILSGQIVACAQRRRLLIADNITEHVAAQRSRKTFIANASHELRTPLTVIIGYLEFLQSDTSLPTGLRPPVEKSIEQSDNMRALINDLLVLSKLEDKSLTPAQVTRINLEQHLQTVMQTLTDSGKTKHHRLEAEVVGNLFIYASEKELNSVSYNLINNAIKYSESGSKISVRWQPHDDKNVAFQVTDEGIGISPEHLSHLTERFYRVDSGRSRQVGGTGLGLSIVKHILERHHGRLEVHSRPGEGSTFTAIFPTDKDKQPEN